MSEQLDRMLADPAQVEETSDALLFRALVISLASMWGPEKQRKTNTLLRGMAEALAEDMVRSEAIPIRGDRARHEREGKAKREAAAKFRRFLPAMIAASCDE